MEEIAKFEKLFGKNFRFSDKDRTALINLLGKKVEPSTRTHVYAGIVSTSNVSGYDGSLFDCMVQVPQQEIRENGLLKKGICRSFSLFTKKYCDYFGLDCKVAWVGDHFFA